MAAPTQPRSADRPRPQVSVSAARTVAVAIAPEPWWLRLARWAELHRWSILGGIIGTAVVLRLLAATLLAVHSDEASSLLAAEMVLERGVPILPSGTVYLQGATLSYLLAPFLALGIGSLDDPFALRLPSVLAGVLAVGLAHGLGRAASGKAIVGLLAAVLIAVEPNAVQWSAHIRMYGLLQPIGIGLAWLTLRDLRGDGGRGTLAGMVSLAWLGIFTHVGFALCLVPVAIVILAKHGWRLWRWPRALFAACIGIGAAPLTLLILNRTLGQQMGSTGEPGPSGRDVSFVGDSLVSLTRLLPWTWDLHSWELSVEPATVAWAAPIIVTAVGIVLLGAQAERAEVDGGIGQRARAFWDALGRGEAWAVLSTWCVVPTLGVLLTVDVPQGRYQLVSLQLGLVALVVLLDLALREGRSPQADRARSDSGPLALAMVGLAAVALVGGTAWRLHSPELSGDYRPVVEYVADRMAPGDLVVTDWPTVTVMGLETTDNVLFLAGPEESWRVDRYTWAGEAGDLRDYWFGIQAIGSMPHLERVLESGRTVWVLVHEDRLGDEDAIFGGSIEDELAENARVVYDAPGNIVVLEASPTIAQENERLGLDDRELGS